jgi:RimJ/RimL family protein N-acetyltransferase
MAITIRAAGPPDAAGAARVLNAVIAEGDFTIFDRPFSVDEERRFIEGLGPREVLHIAIENDEIVGVQVLGRFSTVTESTRHVATMGTWIAASHRRRGVGRALADASFLFAREAGYRKIVIYVLGDNDRSLSFYKGLGFGEIGTARAHVLLNGEFKDEVFLERQIC